LSLSLKERGKLALESIDQRRPRDRLSKALKDSVPQSAEVDDHCGTWLPAGASGEQLSEGRVSGGLDDPRPRLIEQQVGITIAVHLSRRQARCALIGPVERRSRGSAWDNAQAVQNARASDLQNAALREASRYALRAA